VNVMGVVSSTLDDKIGQVVISSYEVLEKVLAMGGVDKMGSR